MDSKALNKALWCDRELFASGGEVDVSKLPMPYSLLVEGAEDIQLPLSELGLEKLKSVCQQAPYGLGDKTLLDTNVRRAWQIEPDKVSCPDLPNLFTSVAHDVAALGLASMGVDSAALELDVKLYKLLLYEAGGHFKFHRDTEKDAGMFATMIIQLPTASGYTGGALTVRQGRRSCNFDFSEGSDQRCFWTVFFCDCEHQLNQVVSGSRLCLVFSLVRNNVDFIPADNLPLFISALPQVKSLLQQWADKGKVRRSGCAYSQRNVPDKKRRLLAIPLAHKYSKSSLSFAGLKGHDRVVAGLVRACDFLELHLCMLTKREIVSEYRECDRDYEYVIDNWITVDDQPALFKKWDIDVRTHVLRGSTCPDDDLTSEKPYYDLFGFLEDEQKENERSGNEGASDEYLYHVVVLVVWPKDKRIDTICSSIRDTAWVVNWLREADGDGFGAPGSQSRGYLQHIVNKFVSGASAMRKVTNSRILFRAVKVLLDVCVKCGLENEALSIMRCFGVEMIATSEFAGGVRAFGWEKSKKIIEEVIKLVEKEMCCPRDDTPSWYTALKSLGGFPPGLLDGTGYQEEATEAAKLLCAKFISNTAELPDDFDLNKDLYAFRSETYGFGCLIEFCLEAGLREEASQILSRLKVPLSLLSGRTLAKVMHYSLPNMDVGKVWDDQPMSDQEYAKQMVQFLLELESLGRRDLALEFAAKPFPCCDYFVEKIDQAGPASDLSLLSDYHWIVLVLLVNKPEIILKISMAKGKQFQAITTMSRAAGLVGLKNNQEMKKVLVELCKDQLLRVVDSAEVSCLDHTKKTDECKDDFKTWKEQLEFFKLLFWLEDEEVLAEMMELVSKRMDVVKRMIDDWLMEEASKFGDGTVKSAAKKLVDARMEYVSREPDFADVMDICRSSSKRMRICGEFDSVEMVGNPREQRKVHEMRMQKWKDESVVRCDEIERLQALRNLF